MQFIHCFLLLTCLSLLVACSSYRAHRSQYQFKSEDGLPHYDRLDYWAAHPRKHDPSDSLPRPLAGEARDTSADVFFIHPTTLTRKTGRKDRNARIDDWLINAKTDYTTILYQASVFNQSARVFAPRYRQANINNFFSDDSASSAAAFEVAYEDVSNAFRYYLQHEHNGRPVIIAGHSQGSMLGMRLLNEFFDGTPLGEKLVAAYLPGWPLPGNFFTSLVVCADSLQTGCICGWQTLRRNYVPNYMDKAQLNGLATNPLTWDTTGEYAPRSANLGSVLTKFNKLYLGTTDGMLRDGLLYVRKPKFPWSFLYTMRNYHIGDINLFYINVRENIRQRITAFLR